MKRVIVLCALLGVLACAPGYVGAQGLLPGLPSLPGLSSFGGLLGGASSCGTGCDEVLGVGGPIFAVGYLGNREGVTYSLDAEGTGVANATQIQHDFPVRGLWLGVGQVVPLGERMAGMVGGSWLVPSYSRSAETYILGDGGTGSRDWSTKIQWWTVEAAALYNFASSFAVIGGFRYDSFQTNFQDPENIHTVPGIQDDEADVTLSHYIPYFGFMVSNGTVKAGFVGFPTLLGSIDYKQTLGGGGGPSRIEGSGSYNGGYFLEFFAEAGAKMMGADLGVFGKYTHVHGIGNVDVDDDRAGGQNDSFDFSLNRQAWILGGNITVPFKLPMM